MQEKIKEVQNYFKNKLLKKDFIIIKIGPHVLDLIIDDKYNFKIWIGNWDIKTSVTLYYNDENFIKIELNQNERLKLRSIIKEDVLNYQNNILLSEKRKQFEQLKKELNLIK